MQPQEQNIIAAANEWLARTSAASVHLPLADGKSLYMGSEADIASMLPGSNAAVLGEPAAAPKTIGELFASVGGWMNGGELGYPSFGSMEALKIYTQRAIRGALSARAADAPSEPSEVALEKLLNEFASANFEGGEADFTNEAGMSLVDISVKRANAARKGIIDLFRSCAADALDSQPTDSRIADLEAQLIECAALSMEWAGKAGAADGRAEKMRAAFHVNMLRAFPEKTHEEIAAEIDRAASSQPTDGEVRNG